MNLKRSDYTNYQEGETIRIAFMIQIPSFWPSVESVYEACRQDQEIETKLFFIREFSLEKAQTAGAEQFLADKQLPFEYYSEEGYKKFRPHIAIYQSPYDATHRNPDTFTLHMKKLGTRIVYIPYGIEIADTEDARAAHFDTFVVRNSWRIYTFSESMTEEYRKYCVNRHAVRACGLPKIDAFYKKNINLCEEVEKRRKNRNIVLWKIHFPKHIYQNGEKVLVTPDLGEYERLETMLSKYHQLFFIVMPHPVFDSPTIDAGLREQAGRLFEKLENHENVYIDKSADYRNSLYHSDAVIIDRSALMVESAIVGVPILYMTNAEYEEPLTAPVEALVSTYRKGNSTEDVLAFLDDLLLGNSISNYETANVLGQILPYQDGKNGFRIKEDLVSSLKNERRGRLRLVIFGTGHSCQYYIDYYNLLNDLQFEIVAFSDNDKHKWGTQLYGIPVLEPAELVNVEYDFLIITTENYHMQIKRKLISELYLDDETILRLDEFCEAMEAYCERPS